MSSTAILTIAACALFLTASTVTAGNVTQTTVWADGEDNYQVHHVYGLAKSTDGTVLAFAEARIDAGDTGEHDLVLKRSFDGGRTWADSQLIEDGNGRALANPTPVVDQTTGKIFLFYGVNSGNESTTVHYRSSTDDGSTWSNATEITGLFDGDPQNRDFHLPGPGHGIQTDSGRLVMQTWHRHGLQDANTIAERQYTVSTVYSDDQGQTWQAGGYVPTGQHMNESRIVQLDKGDLWVNARRAQGGSTGRGVSASSDGGLNWASPTVDTSLGSFVAVDAGFVRLDSAPDAPIVASRPDNKNSRENMTVSLSFDDGQTWPSNRIIEPGPSTYSDVVDLGDGVIGLLYGVGRNEQIPNSLPAEVRFARIPVDAINDSQPAVNPFANGDFEDTTDWGSPGDPSGAQPAGWRDTTRRNAAGKQTGADAIGGAGVSAYMPAFATSTESERRDLSQSLDTSLGSDWTLSFDFSSADPGGANDRSLSGSLNRSGDVVLTFRVVDEDDDGDGDFQLFDGDDWQSIPALKDAVLFDDDVTTSPRTHSITFEADWSADTEAGRALDVTILDSNGQTHTATGLALYRSQINQSDELTGIDFNTFLSEGDYLLDHFRPTAIPEPASAGLFMVGGIALLAQGRTGRR